MSKSKKQQRINQRQRYEAVKQTRGQKGSLPAAKRPQHGTCIECGRKCIPLEELYIAASGWHKCKDTHSCANYESERQRAEVKRSRSPSVQCGMDYDETRKKRGRGVHMTIPAWKDLPPGWHYQHDEENGGLFYWHEDDPDSHTWERPAHPCSDGEASISDDEGHQPRQTRRSSAAFSSESQEKLFDAASDPGQHDRRSDIRCKVRLLKAHPWKTWPKKGDILEVVGAMRDAWTTDWGYTLQKSKEGIEWKWVEPHPDTSRIPRLKRRPNATGANTMPLGEQSVHQASAAAELDPAEDIPGSLSMKLETRSRPRPSCAPHLSR